MSKIVGSSSGGMPRPLSVTRTKPWSPSRAPLDADRAAGLGVLRSALLTAGCRRTCTSRIGSPYTIDRPVVAGDLERVLARVDRRAARRAPPRRRSRRASTGSRRSSSLPALKRATSSRSSTSRVMWWTWRWMMLRIRAGTGASGIVLEHLDGGLQRLQRVAQLVREDREELVLAAIGLGHLLHLALEHLGLEARRCVVQLALVRAGLRLAQLVGLVLQLDRALLQLDEHASPSRAAPRGGSASSGSRTRRARSRGGRRRPATTGR